MRDFFIMLIIVTIFVRIYINKLDINGKDVIAIIIAIVLTGALNFIQFLIKALLDLIFA